MRSLTPLLGRASLILIALALAGSVLAGPQTFDFKDPKGVNNAVFKLDALLEAINGTAHGISGAITFDPEKPEALAGKLVIEAKSLAVPHAMMKEHLQGGQWLDVAKYPEVTFEATKVSGAKTAENTTTADVTGKFTLHGVTNEITVPVKFTYLKDKLGARTMGRMQGDLLVVRAKFTIHRLDFGINPGAPVFSVADEIEISLSVAGGALRQ